MIWFVRDQAGELHRDSHYPGFRRLLLPPFIFLNNSKSHPPLPIRNHTLRSINMRSSSIASETPSRPTSTRTRNPVIHPGMVSPSIDSRRRLSITSDQVQPQSSRNKRKSAANKSVDQSDNASDSSVVCLKPACTKKKKSSSQQTKNKGPSQGQHIDTNVTRSMLRADSKEDEVVVTTRKRHKPDAESADSTDELAQLKAYFLPPTH
ncbi:uncharacterized protein MELLADRAFT_103313 [Melampsora larici-populina 98AG31]|uniref:Uncharacterized protein n=1 Tax=Melampsora larici-populina (strain 98AG31 / pathotype 3-4-7) TaxID=747676 RepID=F4RA02_MELLP|nr:uncharacterized protein MELLADRAFT_103313 [Melampsora larici-populina 98AG31]EGG10624.1 hypothetical protein MELLADRAFT_103313 [Melampsora larici-populina 98AG31]